MAKWAEQSGDEREVGSTPTKKQVWDSLIIIDYRQKVTIFFK
jgi:hypothetical protein